MFFGADAANRYWAILIKPGHKYKMGIMTLHSQYVYLQISQGLKNALHIYAQYLDLMFGHLPPDNKKTNKYQLLIGDHRNAAFTLFVDDYVGLATIFDAMFEFLHTKYFLRCAFGPIYLAPKKTHTFTNQLDFIGFTGNTEELWPSIKHRKQIEE